jgi:phosphatidylinositol-3-phosphatase
MATVPVVLLAGCGGNGSSAPQSSPTTPGTSRTTSSPPSSPPTTHQTRSPSSSPSHRPKAAGVSKILVFIVENHSLDQMRAEMPFTYSLAQRYGYATSYRALTHPSLPNYLAIAGGSAFGVTDDHDPSSHPLAGASVFGSALQAGLSARVYADAMPGPCTTTSAGTYAVRHNPWTYFVSERADCQRSDVPLDAYAADAQAGRLPDAGMVVPDLCHDAHNCALSRSDDWLREEVGLALAGPDFRAGRLAIVVTADEDDGSQDNTVLTVVAHPSLHHVVVGSPLSQLSLCRLYSEVLGTAPLREAATAPSMATAFHLPLARS